MRYTVDLTLEVDEEANIIGVDNNPEDVLVLIEDLLRDVDDVEIVSLIVKED